MSHEQQQQCDSDYEREIFEIFTYFDEDKNGSMDFSEFQRACSLLNQDLTDEDVRCVMENFDINKDGKVTYEEFKNELIKMKERNGDGSEALNEALDCFIHSYDTDGDGKINKKEFRRFLKKCGSQPLKKEEVEEMFMDLDADGDQNIDKEELIKLFTKPTSEF